MINKEIILNADGGIKKDFSDRAIPQNSNNQVSVNVLIPSTCFTGLQNYAVLLAVSRIIGNSETTLNTLVMSVSKSITIDGVVYVKYTAYLSSAYTDKLGQLKFSPYIQTTATTTIDDESVEVISIQQAFTNSNLNVIKSVLPQYDASLEESNIASTIIGMVEGKKIYTFIDSNSASIGQHYYELATGYDPSTDQFNGCLVMSVYGGWTNVYIPYLNNGNVELLEILKTGMFYKISGVSYDSGTSTYTYTREKLSYSKSEIDTALNLKVDKTTKINGHALSGNVDLTKGDVGLGNVVNYGVETTQPTASGDQLYITSKAVYDALQTIYGIISGMATEEQITTINNRLTAIESLLGDGTDDDNIINTLYEVVQTLSGLGEDANILSMINSKVSQSDFDTLNSQINGTNGIATKVSFLYDSNANAYAEIKAQSGTIDILTTDWVANSDANYPYKWELSNGYLVGASYVSVVFDKDSDTSMLSASVGIDDENGKIILYASELPSATISIQLIAIFNSVNAYVLYNQTLVSQVATNTSAISEINNTKLPYLAKNLSAYFGDGVEKTLRITQIANSNGESQTIAVEKLITGASGNENRGKITINSNEIIISRQLIDYASPSNEKSYEIRLNDTDGFKVNLGGKNNGTPYCHYLTFDANGDLKIDGNAVGGGGSQLYQHDIKIYCNPTDENGTFYFSLVCNKSTALTFSDLISLIGTSVAISGKYTRSSTKYICYRLEKVNATTMNVHYTKIDSDNYSVFANGNNMTITDTIRAL